MTYNITVHVALVNKKVQEANLGGVQTWSLTTTTKTEGLHQQCGLEPTHTTVNDCTVL